MSKLVLIRHGQSLWNLENKFAGWKDIDLSDNGIKEAINAGKLINEIARICSGGGGGKPNFLKQVLKILIS